MKLSFDLLISLGLQTPTGINSNYETLGLAAYGNNGRTAVLSSKLLFCFGGLIAIVVIVKDNFGPAIRSLLGVTANNETWLTTILLDDKVSTFILSTLVMLPLSLLRDMTPLERFSAVKICSFLCILSIVVYLWFTLSGTIPGVPAHGHIIKRWVEVRNGFVQNIGTYVFTFIAQHTCHLVYRSLKPELRNNRDWGMVTCLALSMSVLLALPIGLFPYMT